MTPDRGSQIKNLYLHALEMEVSRRDEFLRRACAGDDALRREVESLLAGAGDGRLTSAPTRELPANEAARTGGAGPEAEHTSSPAVQHAPWWMVVFAASYVALLALIPYLVIWGPTDLLGLTADFEDGTMVVRAVEPDSIPARAGV